MKLLAVVLLLGSATASADELYSIGARVGGYGFRRAEDPGLTEGALGDSWSECRMNGLGLFVDRALAGPWFVEGGLDTYFSIGQGEPTDLPLDRESLLLSAAIGARTHFTSWLAGYVQLGAGVELAKLSVPYGDDAIRADKVFPEGFAGVGFDIKVARGTFIGASLRTLVMANFNYEMPMQTNQWVAAPSPDAVFAATPSLAAQGQFYLRRDL
ncbi:MAG TPA: hypothetical protein VGG28_03370 [Kofleriaceae bacterium]|jgi:hypothetical protein